MLDGCDRVDKTDGIRSLQCHNSDALKAALEYGRTVLAYRQSLPEKRRMSFDKQRVKEETTLLVCTHSVKGKDGVVVSATTDAPCYIDKLHVLQNRYEKRLEGDAREEGTRDIDRHIALQQKLIDLRYLAKNANEHGFYEDQTRDAIIKWQRTVRGTPEPDGLLSDTDADILQATPDSVPNTTAINNPVSSAPPLIIFDILISLTIIGGIPALITYFYLNFRRNNRKAIKECKEEIERNHLLLHRRWQQLVFRDHYGTNDYRRWRNEVKYFCNTRIMPILESHGREYLWPTIKDEITDLIWNKAQKKPLFQHRDPSATFSPSMSPTDYERYCARQLEKAGWDARTTKGSGDQGADIIADRNGRKAVFQCKLYSKPVGNSAVQEISAARNHEGADTAAVVSNAGYTPAARSLAATNHIHLLHHDDLEQFQI